MATPKTTTTLLSAAKILLMSSGLIFIAIIVSLTLPHFFTLLTTSSPQLPAVWTAVKGWLRPPYLYFIINGIIITIVVSSRLHHSHQQTHHAPPEHEVSTYAPVNLKGGHLHHHHQHQQQDVISVRADQFSPYGAVLARDVEVDGVVGDEYYGVVLVKEVVEPVEEVVVKEVMECPVEDAVVFGDEEVEEEVATWTPPPPAQKPLMRQAALPGLFMERPPASSRFGHHRRPAKAGVTEGAKALRRVAKPKKHDTLESTWKAITEGRHIPLTRHLKSKSDTWENQPCQINVLDDNLPEMVKKSQTFNDRTNHTTPPVPTTKLRKEPSLGQDELNRRVEAFINKFNQEMRLQRQQSAQQFMEMINRAA